jgi:hypothetical protein
MATTTELHTKQYFMEELLRFREVMGNKEIMLNPEKRDRALSGFATVYLNTDFEGDYSLPSMFDSQVIEFTKRCAMIDASVRLTESFSPTYKKLA